MKRSKFLKLSGLLPLMGLNQFQSTFSEPDNDPLDRELVFEFVKAGHNDLTKVKKLLVENPAVLNRSWDWGDGDFETALGGASHLGNKDIASYLLSEGARANIFTLTVLGHTDIVKNMIHLYPNLIHSSGPHGFTLLHHAKVGGVENDELVDFLISKGLKTTKFG